MITILAGGTGSVKLVRGLAAIRRDIAVICNVSDNVWLYGLYICPDIDTVIYGLAGMLDEKRGWGIRGDTFSFLDQLGKAGERPWFGLGDRDLAMHVLRTSMINKEGKSLSEVTAFFAGKLGVSARIIPSTDQHVETRVATAKGDLHLQEFWVRDRGRPKVTGVRYAGIEDAVASPAAIKAIRNSKRVIIAPGNPISSIGTTIALAGIRAELARSRRRVIAVSPMIGNRAVSGPAAKYMKAVGLQSTPAGVAEFYKDIAGAMVISKGDRGMSDKIRQLGMDVYEADITMKNKRDEVRLAKYLLEIET
ncbi:MAG: 2-phospho-L-lactate transferase [Nitrososphaera sp.]